MEDLKVIPFGTEESAESAADKMDGDPVVFERPSKVGYGVMTDESMAARASYLLDDPTADEIDLVAETDPDLVGAPRLTFGVPQVEAWDAAEALLDGEEVYDVHAMSDGTLQVIFEASPMDVETVRKEPATNYEVGYVEGVLQAHDADYTDVSVCTDPEVQHRVEVAP